MLGGIQDVFEPTRRYLRFVAAVRGYADHLNNSASLIDYTRRRAEFYAQIAATSGLKQKGLGYSQRRRPPAVLVEAAENYGAGSAASVDCPVTTPFGAAAATKAPW